MEGCTAQRQICSFWIKRLMLLIVEVCDQGVAGLRAWETPHCWKLLLALYFCTRKGLRMICHSHWMRRKGVLHKSVDCRHRAQHRAGRNTQLLNCAHGPDLYQWSFAEATQTKTKRLKDFSRTLVSKMLESCQYLQGPWHLAATKRQTPCWHLSKMSGRSWIDRVSYTWMSAQDALSMSWIPWIHTTTGPLLQQRPWGHSSESCCCL